MNKKRFKKTEIQLVLKEYKNGMSIPEVLNKFGISQATFYNWKSKYGSQPATDSMLLSKLKEENDRLKRMYADISLENMMLKMQLEKKE